MKLLTVTILALLLAMAGAGEGQGAVRFERTYKAGEKVVYTASQSIDIDGIRTMSCDIALAVGKVPPGGGADVRVHMSDLHLTSNDTATLPSDFALSIRANNMPEKFTPTMGGTDFFVLLLQLAGYTPDKAVKVGDEFPVVWKGSPMAFEGSGKVTAISAEKKTIETAIKVKVSFSGQDAGEFEFKST